MREPSISSLPASNIRPFNNRSVVWMFAPVLSNLGPEKGQTPRPGLFWRFTGKPSSCQPCLGKLCRKTAQKFWVMRSLFSTTFCNSYGQYTCCWLALRLPAGRSVPRRAKVSEHHSRNALAGCLSLSVRKFDTTGRPRPFRTVSSSLDNVETINYCLSQCYTQACLVGSFCTSGDRVGVADKAPSQGHLLCPTDMPGRCSPAAAPASNAAWLALFRRGGGGGAHLAVAPQSRSHAASSTSRQPPGGGGGL